MFGVPSADELAFMQSALVEQVCIGQNEIIFNFDGSRSIVVEGDFQITAGSETVDSSTPAGSANVAVLLLGSAVASVANTEEASLLLTFKNGSTLELFDRSREYESFRVQFKDRTFVA